MQRSGSAPAFIKSHLSTAWGCELRTHLDRELHMVDRSYTPLAQLPQCQPKQHSVSTRALAFSFDVNHRQTDRQTDRQTGTGSTARAAVSPLCTKLASACALCLVWFAWCRMTARRATFDAVPTPPFLGFAGQCMHALQRNAWTWSHRRTWPTRRAKRS